MKISKKLLDQDRESFGRLLTMTSLFESDFSIDWIIPLTGLRASEALEILESGSARDWCNYSEPSKKYRL